MSRARQLGLFVLASLLTRGAFLGVPVLDLDEAAHLVGSQVLLDGGRLYTDFADNKPPLLYVHYAAAQALLGRGLPEVRLFTAIVTLPLTALGLSAFFRYDRRGLWAGLVFLVASASFLAHDMHAAHSEIPMLLPAAWAAAVALGEGRAPSAARALAAGLLLGVATLFKQPAAFWLPALASLAIGTRAGRAAALVAAVAAGFAAPLAATWVAFAATGGADELVFWTLRWNLGYVANPISAAEALERAARGPFAFVLASLPLLWAARAPWPGDGATRRRVALLLFLSIPPVLLGFRFFPHYIVPLYVPLALLAAPRVSQLLTRPLSVAGRRFAAAMVLLLGGFTVANAVLYFGPFDVYAETRPLYGEVARTLERDACFAGARLFVWGYAPMFYVASGLPPATRFVVPQAGLTGYVAGNVGSTRGGFDGRGLVDPRHWDLLMSDLLAHSPTFVLDTAPSGLYRWNRFPLTDFPRLASFVREGYELVAAVGGVRIYRRRGCAPKA
ncbi:MAG TPA: hypothetical protein VFM88_01415 [Vicinamibacteria bacterium]|nr:hypothetical protein [Vicinamibacteria bacterium]